MRKSIDATQLQNAFQRGQIQWQRHSLEQIMNKKYEAVCPLCKGKKVDGTTTFTVDLGFGILVVRDVPALVCSQCGTDWLVNDVAAYLETVVENAKKTRRQIDVTVYNAQRNSSVLSRGRQRRVGLVN